VCMARRHSIVDSAQREGRVAKITTDGHHPDEHVDDAHTIELAQETVTVSKDTVVKGRVSVRTVTEEFRENVSAELSGRMVVVEHVPVDRIVDAMPEVRVEGDVTIVPVFEEVLVVERRIRLVEEIHVRHETTTETVELPVTVRRQRAVVERTAAGNVPVIPQNEE